jgi:signal transduction histidine kinase
MKRFITILLTFLSLNSFSQDSFKPKTIHTTYISPDKLFEKPKEEKKIESDTTNIVNTEESFIKNLPKSYETISKNDMKKLAAELDTKIQLLLQERNQLIKDHVSDEVIQTKDGAIKVLKKEKQIIDLSIEKNDLKIETTDLKIEKSKLKNYLTITGISIILLVLAVAVLIQRKTIKHQDKEIINQLMDINEKNTYLEYAARIIRHDMHSGINTYMPRGLSSLERRLTADDIKNLKLDSAIKMIKDGLLHTQKVYKSVYEFTNLVKQNVVIEKELVDIKTLLTDFLSNSAYKTQVEIYDIGSISVNKVLFCNAIDNLIRNGLKYNDSDNKLVKVFLDENYIIIEDNGRGFSESKFQEIINASYKNSDIYKEEIGLGLHISNAILKEHGFSISCERLNNGTKIKIKI